MHRRISRAVVLASASMLWGCYDGRQATDGSGAADGAETDGSIDGGADGLSGSLPGDDSGGDGPGDDDGPAACQPGALGCPCLDGDCSGTLACLDDVCVQAAAPTVECPGVAMAGLAILLSAELPDDAGADGFTWTQTEGTTADIDYADAQSAVAYVPAAAGTGEVLKFRLDASLGGVTTSRECEVTVLATEVGAVFDGEGAPDVLALGGGALERQGGDGFWIGTPAGAFARVGNGTIESSFDLGSAISDIRDYDDNRLLVAQPELQRIAVFNTANSQVSPFIETLSGGGPLGAARAMVVDDDENIYIATDGQIVFYDAADDGEPASTIVMSTVPDGQPVALALGQVPVPPQDDEGDEGVVLYVGTSTGAVLQLGLTEAENGNGPTIGAIEPYLDVPGGNAVTGLAVDDAGNMWVGTATQLVLVRRRFDLGPSVARQIDPAAGLAGFAGLRADDEVLLWIDPSTGAVARLSTSGGQDQ